MAGLPSATKQRGYIVADEDHCAMNACRNKLRPHPTTVRHMSTNLVHRWLTDFHGFLHPAHGFVLSGLAAAMSCADGAQQQRAALQHEQKSEISEEAATAMGVCLEVVPPKAG